MVLPNLPPEKGAAIRRTADRNHPVSRPASLFYLRPAQMLRVYFKYDRDLLKDLCRMANECLRDYLRVALDLPEGILGAVMTIHTFGEYLDFHPHLHALVADGLFTSAGMFHVMPDVSLKPLEELFRARVLSFLFGKGLLTKERADMLMSWKHSGFNVHRRRRVELMSATTWYASPNTSFVTRSPSRKCTLARTARSSTGLA
ncbi:MAG: hypothetical protein EOL86_14620 [Deltaproteobacteria bacterium]|nr:hypothetical protein [Deltaproteobacteria bacterium]